MGHFVKQIGLQQSDRPIDSHTSQRGQPALQQFELLGIGEGPPQSVRLLLPPVAAHTIPVIGTSFQLGPRAWANQWHNPLKWIIHS